jgi:hypothetical protein
LKLLKTNFNIDEQPVYIIKNALAQHGLPADEIQKIVSLLVLCEKHIYSPFTESYDRESCDAIADEITNILNKGGRQDTST